MMNFIYIFCILIVYVLAKQHYDLYDDDIALRFYDLNTKNDKNKLNKFMIHGFLRIFG
jgi:hypothetical protein